MLLTVQVEAGAHTALSVPELAVLGDGEDRFVYIVDDQGKAQRTEVRTGARQDGRIEIVDGLSRGQKVVTDGIVKLSDGLPVRVTKNAGAAGSTENTMAARKRVLEGKSVSGSESLCGRSDYNKHAGLEKKRKKEP